MLQLHSSVNHEKDVGLDPDGLYSIRGEGHSKSRNEKMRKWEERTSHFTSQQTAENFFFFCCDYQM